MSRKVSLGADCINLILPTIWWLNRLVWWISVAGQPAAVNTRNYLLSTWQRWQGLQNKGVNKSSRNTIFGEGTYTLLARVIGDPINDWKLTPKFCSHFYCKIIHSEIKIVFLSSLQHRWISSHGCSIKQDSLSNKNWRLSTLWTSILECLDAAAAEKCAIWSKLSIFHFADIIE